MGETGLTTKEVLLAEARGEINQQPDTSQKTVKQIIKENTLTYFNFIFAVLSVLVIAAGAFRSLTFLGPVFFNSLIGIVQQLRAKKILDELSILSHSRIRVIRDGQEQEIYTDKLVKGDVVIFKSGNQICADAEVLAGEVTVNESLLTGESDEISKKRGDKLLSGSFVVTGECRARLTHVGADSYVSRLEAQAREMSGREESEMVRGINRFVLMAGIAILPIGILLFIQGYHNNVPFSENVTSMVAAVVGMIPEGLYVLVSMTLAVSAAGLARKKVMLHDMKSIEALARVDVLCVDKTGTITENDMVVEDTVLPEQEGGTHLQEGDKSRLEALLSDYLYAQKDDNATMEALRNRFPADSGNVSSRNISRVLPFTSKNKYSAVRFGEETCVMGAPDIVLRKDYQRWAGQIERYSSQGFRLLVLARAEGDVFESGLMECRTEPLLFILLKNPIRQAAKDTFQYFKDQDVDIKVISGDHPMTVSHIAGQAGIPNSDRAVDASSLKDISDIEAAVDRYTVFARVTPDRKKQIVEALQKKGHTVAMTGDGVNDIMAMKTADCSVAMASGSEAAVQAAQVVLLDSDFAHMPQIVAEGRRVIGNIERSSTLFLCKNLFSMFLALFSIVIVLSYPLQPEQVSLISGFNIGIPAFLLAMEPRERRITGHFMKKVLLKALPAALTDFVLIAALMIFGTVFGVSEKDVSVAATFLLGIVGFMILYYISRPLTKYRIAVLITCMIGFGVSAYLFHGWFGISYVSMKCMMLFVLFAVAAEPCMKYLTRLSDYLLNKLSAC